MLRPPKNFTKCLISTPCRLVGEYESEDILFTLAWPELMAPNARRTQYLAGPTHRRFLIASLETESSSEDETRSGPIPNHHWLGDFFAVCLSVFFGKRFDHHGLVETQGMFCIPAYDSIREISVFNLAPYNSEPRIDLEIELNLSKLNMISPLIRVTEPNSAVDTFFTAGNFYLQALRIVEEQPEVAYLDLVTAGEILSNYFKFSEEHLYGEDLKELLEEIRSQLPDGEKKANKIKSRLFQVRHRFKLTLRRFLNTSFFTKSESKNNFGAFTEDNITASIVAAYDLRSRYVHTGERFGTWIHSLEHFGAEKQIGTPIVEDKSYKKILERAPTFIGLERIIRYCLLAFIHKEICQIDPCLD